ncbi:MAG: IreB family regulatory phosphoprotein [Bacillota bacterium]
MAHDSSQETVMFKVQAEEVNQAREILLAVYAALKEKGYNPINQLVGYLLSGDPAYITSHGNARSLIRRLERDELLEELVKNYLEQK